MNEASKLKISIRHLLIFNKCYPELCLFMRKRHMRIMFIIENKGEFKTNSDIEKHKKTAIKWAILNDFFYECTMDFVLI